MLYKNLCEDIYFQVVTFSQLRGDVFVEGLYTAAQHGAVVETSFHQRPAHRETSTNPT